MSLIFTVPLSNIIKELSLSETYMPCNPENILISSMDINRLGLELTGFLDYFDNTRIVIIGNTENSFLVRFNEHERLEIIKRIFELKPPAVIITRGIEPYSQIMEAAKLHKIPVLQTGETTSSMIAELISYMNVELAPRITRHGVLVEVYGEGMLLTGDSGVGKSETAVELIKRGHRLVADDAIEIRKISKGTLIGASPENIRHFIEIRGIGIVNARRIFGMGSVKMTEKIDMVIKLEPWDDSKPYDRLGMDNEYAEILGIDIPVITIPVKPGRNLAVILEVAAMNNRQKKMGYNAAHELFSGLGMDYDEEKKSLKQEINWNT